MNIDEKIKEYEQITKDREQNISLEDLFTIEKRNTDIKTRRVAIIDSILDGIRVGYAVGYEHGKKQGGARK